MVQVLLDGELVHRSDVNRSTKSRHAYTWHVTDGRSEYDDLNWLQPWRKSGFATLYSTAEGPGRRLTKKRTATG